MFRRVLYAIPALFALSAATAQACSPMPPQVPPAPSYPGETPEEYQRRLDAYWLEVKHKEAVSGARSEGFAEGYQAALWDSAPVIALVEVVARDGSGYSPMEFGGPRTTFKVVKAVKGKPSSKTFDMGYDGMTSCGPYGHVSMTQGSLGERFVVFANSRKLGMKTIIEGYERSQARNYRTKELLQDPPSTAEGK